MSELAGGLDNEQEQPGGQEDQAQQEIQGKPKKEGTQGELTAQEQKASSKGWTDKETWIDNGNDEDRWKTASEFNRDAKHQHQISSLERQLGNAQNQFNQELDRRLSGVKKLHDAQLSTLKEQQLAAVENADTESFNRAQKRIDDLQEAPPQPARTNNPALDAMNDWDAKNPWIFDNSAKAAFAKSEFKRLAPANATARDVDRVIELMEHSINKEFPEQQQRPRRDMANRSESPRRTGKRAPTQLAMADTTSDERKMRDFWASDAKGEKAFLQAVLDDRGARA